MEFQGLYEQKLKKNITITISIEINNLIC